MILNILSWEFLWVGNPQDLGNTAITTVRGLIWKQSAISIYLMFISIPHSAKHTQYLHRYMLYYIT